MMHKKRLQRKPQSLMLLSMVVLVSAVFTTVVRADNPYLLSAPVLNDGGQITPAPLTDKPFAGWLFPHGLTAEVSADGIYHFSTSDGERVNHNLQFIFSVGYAEEDQTPRSDFDMTPGLSAEEHYPLSGPTLFMSIGKRW